MTKLIKMIRGDGAEAHVEPQDVETWRGYGFESADPPKPSPFDHDGSGEPGGSLPKAQRPKRKAKK